MADVVTLPLVAPLVTRLADQLQQRGWRLACAESCTGGLIAAACTDLAGSSLWFESGIVSYSNAAKCDLLGVDPQLIERHGAVSVEVAAAMAQGARQRARVELSVAVTGIAGPGGGSADKPVGTVCFGFASPSGAWTEHMVFAGDRQQIRAASVHHALAGLLRVLS